MESRDDLGRQLVQAREALASQRERSDKLGGSLEQTREALGKAEAQLQQTGDDLQQLSERGQQERQELRDSVDAHALSLATVEQRLDGLTEDKATAEELAKARQEQAEALDAARVALEQQLATAQQRVDKLGQRVDEQVAGLATLSEEVGQLQEELAPAAELARTRAELARTQEELATTRGELEEAREKLERRLLLIQEDLELQFGQAAQGRADLLQKLEAQDAALANLDVQLTATTPEVARTRKALEGSTTELQRRVDYQAEAASTVARQVEELSRREAERAAKPATRVTWPTYALAAGVLIALILGIVALARGPEPTAPGVAPSTTRPAAAKPALPDTPPDKPAPAPVRPDAAPAAAPDAAPAAVVAPAQIPQAEVRRLSRRQRKLLARRIKQARRLINKKRYKAARRLLTRTLALTDDYRLRQLLSAAHEQDGQLAAAVPNMQRAIALAPRRTRPWLYEHLGLLQIKAGRRAEGCEVLRKALRQSRRLQRAGQALQRLCR